MGNNVLIVDDEISLLEIYERIIKDFGYNVIKANSGDEAIRALNTHAIDLVLSDMRMANGDGLDVIKHVRNELQSHIPVIILTGFSNQSQNEIIAQGADTILFKPISLNDLINTILIYLPQTKQASA